MIETIFELVCLIITTYVTSEVIVFPILQSLIYIIELFNKGSFLMCHCVGIEFFPLCYVSFISSRSHTHPPLPQLKGR